jgi:enamine deaminase RidA (YjgF/YER057c/UK114 family)
MLVQQHPDGLPPVNGYSHAVSFSGRMVAISGQVPLDVQESWPGTNRSVPGRDRRTRRDVTKI